MRARLSFVGAVVAAVALLAFAAIAPSVRRGFIRDVTTWDAPAAPPVELPGGTQGAGLAPVDRVRVVLIDGLGASTARMLRTWSQLCTRGARLTVDVGFPTVSLPVEVALWSGLTQQQTGVVFRSDRPLVPALDRRGLPARVPGSIAIAENHGYIVRSLGFATALPLGGDRVERDQDPAGWATEWLDRARAAVASTTPLVFVHILRVDTAGHKFGAASAQYAEAAGEADAILASLVASAPEGRWFLLADHGHLPGGGHGGDDADIRRVEGCIVGAGITPTSGGPVHVVDISRALADSLGLPLDRRSVGRPLSVALAHPLRGNESIPALPLGTGAAAIALLALGIAASVWAVRRWWIAPWWFVIACLLLVLLRGAPTLSMPMVYGRESLGDLFDLDRRLMMRSWLAALPFTFACVWFGQPRVGAARVLVAQLALPFALLAAVWTACHAWPSLFGAEVAPVVPRYTALASPLMLIVAQGSAAAALAVLARLALAASGRSGSSETPRTAP